MSHSDGPIDPFECAAPFHKKNDLQMQLGSRRSESTQGSSVSKIIFDHGIFLNPSNLKKGPFKDSDETIKMLPSIKTKTSIKPKLQFVKSINSNVTANHCLNQPNDPERNELNVTTAKKSRTLSRIFSSKNHMKEETNNKYTKPEADLSSLNEKSVADENVYFSVNFNSDWIANDSTVDAKEPEVYDMKPIITEEGNDFYTVEENTSTSPISAVDFWKVSLQDELIHTAAQKDDLHFTTNLKNQERKISSLDQKNKTSCILKELASMNSNLQKSTKRNQTAKQSQKSGDSQSNDDGTQKKNSDKDENSLQQARTGHKVKKFTKFAHLSSEDEEGCPLAGFEEEELESFSADIEKEKYDMTSIIVNRTEPNKANLKASQIKNIKKIDPSVYMKANSKDSNKEGNAFSDKRISILDNVIRKGEDNKVANCNQSMWDDNFNSFIHNAMGIETCISSSNMEGTANSPPVTKLNESISVTCGTSNSTPEANPIDKLDTVYNWDKFGHPFDSSDSSVGSDERQFIINFVLQETPKVDNKKKSRIYGAQEKTAFRSIDEIKKYIVQSKLNPPKTMSSGKEGEGMHSVKSKKSYGVWPTFNFTIPLF